MLVTDAAPTDSLTTDTKSTRDAIQFEFGPKCSDFHCTVSAQRALFSLTV